MNTRPAELPETLVPDGTARGAAEEVTERDDVPASRYEILGELARGGMGIVFRARDRLLNREVGIKTLLKNPAPAPVLARFRAEAHITGQLQHPSVPPVHELGVLPDGRPFIAMKLIKGQTLDALLKARTDLDADRARFVAVFEQIAHGVAYAHAHNVVHRDLKPANVMVGAHGEVQVMDWGLAKVIGQSADPTAPDGETAPATVIGAPDGDSDSLAGRAFGTPAYMPVEQAIGAIDRVAARSDVFSLGGILCAILTGKPPYVSATGEGARQLAATAKLADCRARLSACGAEPELVALCNWCLQPEPDDRPADADAVARAVAAFRADVERRARQAELDRVRAEGARATAEATAAEALNTRREAEARADAERAKAREQRARQRVQLALLAAVALLAAAVGAFAWWTEKSANERRTERAVAERQAQQGVNSALALADALRRQARFKEAERALDQAREQVGHGAEDRRTEVANAVADLAFAARADEIRHEKYGWLVVHNSVHPKFDPWSASEKYRTAFSKRGLDPIERPVAETVALIERSPIRDVMLDALDDWALYEKVDAPWARLLELARLLDKSEWAKRLREPAVRKDANELAALAERADFNRPMLLAVLANLMAGQKLNPRPLLVKALARNPNSLELTIALGLFGTEEHVVAFERIRALRPDSAAACLNLALARAKRSGAGGGLLGRIRYRASEGPLALAFFERASELDPRSGLAHHYLGVLEYDAGRYERAVRHARDALRVDPNLHAAHRLLVIALKNSDDIVGAGEALAEATRFDPTNPMWLELRAELSPNRAPPPRQK